MVSKLGQKLPPPATSGMPSPVRSYTSPKHAARPHWDHSFASGSRALIGDKAYDADSLINALDRRAITAVIPPKANRKVKRDCDFALYCERNLVERFFNKIKHYRAIATRYDKLEFSCRRPAGRGYHPTQLRTRPRRVD